MYGRLRRIYTGSVINSCTLFWKERRSYKMRLKCVVDGLSVIKLSNFYLLFYKHFRNFDFWGLKKQLFQKKSCQIVWLSRGFYKNGKFSSYYELELITTKLIEKIVYILFFNFYFRHFLKFWLLNLENSNSLILPL